MSSEEPRRSRLGYVISVVGELVLYFSVGLLVITVLFGIFGRADTIPDFAGELVWTFIASVVLIAVITLTGYLFVRVISWSYGSREMQKEGPQAGESQAKEL